MAATRTATRMAGALAVAAIIATGTPDASAAAPWRAVRMVVDDGLDVTTEVTYRYDPSVPAVLVDTQLTLLNATPPVTGGGVVTSAYWDAYGLLTVAEANGFSARSADGQPLSVRTEPAPDTEGFVIVTVDLGRSLFHREAISLNISYAIPATTPRSGGTTRVNSAFATFTAFASGADAGRTAVNIVVPAGYETIIDGGEVADDMEVFRDGSTIVYTAPAIAAPEDFIVDVSTRNDRALVSEYVDLDPGVVNVRAWPGDEEWADFVSEQVADGIPALEEVTGLAWPTGDSVEVIESVTPYLYGYAGWYQPVENLIEIGDELDQHVILHELSHVWFNDDLFRTRWILEGLAEEIAARVGRGLGGEPPEPAMPAAEAPGHQPLISWSAPRRQDDTTQDQEHYGYEASYAVVHQLVEEIGDDGLQRVLRAADERWTAYPGEDRTEKLTRAPGWRQLLDWLEEVGGAEDAEELFRERVVDESTVSELDQRAEARDAYTEIEEVGGAWAPPAALRRSMRDWDFGGADKLIPEVRRVLAARGELRVAMRQAGLREPGDLEPMYEGPDAGPVAVRAEVEKATEAAATIGRAEDAVDGGGPLATVGGLFSSADDTLVRARSLFETGDVFGSVRAAEDAERQADAEATRGAVLVGAVAGVALLVALGGIVAVRRRRPPPPPPPPPPTSLSDWGGPLTT